MTSTDKITARVKALLARAEHPGTPEAEAQAAAAKAAELMMRHAISEAAVRAESGQAPEPVEVARYDVPGTGGHGKARAAALSAAAIAYGCKVAVYGNDATRYRRTMLMVGTRSSLAALRVLLPSIELQMEMAARAATRAYGKRLRVMTSWQDPGDRRTYTTAFYRDYVRGYGYGVADKIEATRGQIVDEAAGTGTALVLAGDAARVQAEFTRQFPRLGKGRPEHHRHPGAMAAGRTAGRRADIGSHHLGSGRAQLTRGG